MKSVRFQPRLVASVLARQKRATWRLDGDKGIRTGERIALLQNGSDVPFGYAKVVDVYQKTLGDMLEDDFHGGKFFSSIEESITIFQDYYPSLQVDQHSIATVLVFDLE